MRFSCSNIEVSYSRDGIEVEVYDPNSSEIFEEIADDVNDEIQERAIENFSLFSDSQIEDLLDEIGSLKCMEYFDLVGNEQSK